MHRLSNFGVEIRKSAILEWTKFGAYGVGISVSFPDIDGSEAVNSTDLSAHNTLWLAAINTSQHDPRVDADLNGVINSTDTSRLISDWLTAPAAGHGRVSLSVGGRPEGLRRSIPKTLDAGAFLC